MDKTSSTNNFHDQLSLERLNAIKNKYADIYDYLVISAAKMLDMDVCTLSISLENQVYIIASNDPTLDPIYDQNINFSLVNGIYSNQYEPIHPVKNLDIKFHRSFSINGLNGTVLGNLNIFNSKDRTLSAEDEKILKMVVQQATSWCLYKEKDQILSNHDILFEKIE